MADTCTRCGMEAKYSIILSTYSASASGQRQVRFCSACYAAHRAWLSVRVPSCDVGGGAEIERPKDDRDLLRDVARQRDAALDDLRGVTERWKEATEEIATLRVALGTLPAVHVLSPLAVYPVAVAVGEPYPVCARCQRLAADCSCQPPLICPARGTALVDWNKP